MERERERHERQPGHDVSDTMVAGHGYEAKWNAQDVRNPVVMVVWVEAHYDVPVTKTSNVGGWVMETTRLR